MDQSRNHVFRIVWPPSAVKLLGRSSCSKPGSLQHVGVRQIDGFPSISVYYHSLKVSRIKPTGLLQYSPLVNVLFFLPIFPRPQTSFLSNPLSVRFPFRSKRQYALGTLTITRTRWYPWMAGEAKGHSCRRSQANYMIRDTE